MNKNKLKIIFRIILSEDISRVIIRLFPEYRDLNESTMTILVRKIDPFVRKAAHITVYGILGILCFLFGITFKSKDYKKQYLYSLFYCFVYAISDEMHQYFVSGRAGKGTDVLIDLLGAFIGITFIWSIVPNKKKLKSKKENKKINE